MTDTTQELFDIVDENNNLLGITKPRDVVHREMKDWHRSTGIWIVNDRKQFLCQQRSVFKDEDPGMWKSNFGGHLKAGETYDENAIHELDEELGLKVHMQDLIPVDLIKSENKRHFSQLYLYRWNGDLSELHFNDGEVVQVKWMSAEDFEMLMRDQGFSDYNFNEKVLEVI